MRIEYDEPLKEYMRRKRLSVIAVEVVTSNSDIEITELYVHLIRDSQAEYFKTKKRFRAVQGELGEVLLPPYRLEYDDTLRFSLKKVWFFTSVRQEGIRL